MSDGNSGCDNMHAHVCGPCARRARLHTSTHFYEWLTYSSLKFIGFGEQTDRQSFSLSAPLGDRKSRGVTFGCNVLTKYCIYSLNFIFTWNGGSWYKKGDLTLTECAEDGGTKLFVWRQQNIW